MSNKVQIYAQMVARCEMRRDLTPRESEQNDRAHDKAEHMLDRALIESGVHWAETPKHMAAVVEAAKRELEARHD